MPSKTDWIRLAPVCSDVYVYQADFLCEDCAGKIIEKLEKEGVEDTGDTDDFPQGPYPEGGGEADSPHHCGSGAGCVNAIKVPGGSKIGCPLGNPLTDDGVEYLRKSLAHDLVCKRGAHSHGVNLLWSSIYPDACSEGRLANVAIEIDNPSAFPLKRSLISLLSSLKKVDLRILPEIFSDCSYVYGGATSASQTILWRLRGDNETGKFDDLETVHLPASEANERKLRDMIEEAISEGAWD
jgi:hypothetical protein